MLYFGLIGDKICWSDKENPLTMRATTSLVETPSVLWVATNIPLLKKRIKTKINISIFLEQCVSFYQHSILIEGQKSKVYAKQKFCTKLFSQIIDGWQRKNKFLTLLHNKCMTNGVQFFMNLYSSRDNDNFCNEKMK